MEAWEGGAPLLQLLSFLDWGSLPPCLSREAPQTQMWLVQSSPQRQSSSSALYVMTKEPPPLHTRAHTLLQCERNITSHTLGVKKKTDKGL